MLDIPFINQLGELVRKLYRKNIIGTLDANVTDGSLLGHVMAKTDVTNFDRTTDSLEGIANAVAGLNDVSAADVNAQADQALIDYDPPTKAELDTTESNIRGANSDTLKTLSDKMDGIGAPMGLYNTPIFEDWGGFKPDYELPDASAITDAEMALGNRDLHRPLWIQYGDGSSDYTSIHPTISYDSTTDDRFGLVMDWASSIPGRCIIVASRPWYINPYATETTPRAKKLIFETWFIPDILQHQVGLRVFQFVGLWSYPVQSMGSCSYTLLPTRYSVSSPMIGFSSGSGQNQMMGKMGGTYTTGFGITSPNRPQWLRLEYTYATDSCEFFCNNVSKGTITGQKYNASSLPNTTISRPFYPCIITDTEAYGDDPTVVCQRFNLWEE